MQLFGSLPPDIFSDTLDNFEAGRRTGLHIAALKCLLIFGLKNNYETKLTTLSLNELEDLTSLSKPMLIKGIKRLIELNLIEKIPQEKKNLKNVYKLIYKSSKQFTRVPYQNLIRNISCFPNKGVFTLVALKAYMIMLQVRDRNNQFARISYARFSEYGINKNHLAKGLKILVCADWITTSKQAQPDGSSKQSCNFYEINDLNLPRWRSS